jgi:alkylhydroperoxidase family enzyme
MHTAAVRRLTGDEHLNSEFATTWTAYDLDSKTRALLGYAKKVTEAPSMIGDSDVEALRDAGWDERGIYEATVLISFFNMTGRIEAVSGLPPDQIPERSRFAEGNPDQQTAVSVGTAD